MKLMKNKKGFGGILIFTVLLFTILIIGFIASIVIALFDYTGDTITPIINEIGVVGDTNLSEVADYTITPANTLVQALPWLVGFGYVAALIFSMVFVMMYESNPHPAFIGAYIFFVILIIFGAIVMSNMYENIYTGTDELATRLQGQTTLSYMILFSPFILTLIAVITGIFLFSRPSQASGGGI